MEEEVIEVSDDKEKVAEEVSLSSIAVDLKRLEEKELEGDLKEMYDLVKTKIEMTIADQHFTSELVRPLLIGIIQVVQSFTKGKYGKMDGSQKRAMAMELTKHVMKDLHHKGQITDEAYEYTMLGLELFGPALFDGLKALSKKIGEVVDDIQEHGAAGCCGRNFGRRRNNNGDNQ